jgi:hypothetical protein
MGYYHTSAHSGVGFDIHVLGPVIASMWSLETIVREKRKRNSMVEDLEERD